MCARGTMCDAPTGTRLQPTPGRIHPMAAFGRFLCSFSSFHSRAEGDPRMPCLSFPTGLSPTKPTRLARTRWVPPSVPPVTRGHRFPQHCQAALHNNLFFVKHRTADDLARSSSKQSRTGGIMATAHGHLGSRDELRLDEASARHRSPASSSGPTLQNQHPSLTQHSTACTRDTRTEHQGSAAPFLLLAHDGTRHQ